MCEIGKFQKMVTVKESKELLAWRRFDLDTDGSLCSTNADYVYKKGVNTSPKPGPARINAYKYHAAASRGFYAMKRRDSHGVGTVWGRVQLWGRIAVHSRGYRAEKLRILRIELEKPPVPPIQLVAKKYGIPVA